MNLLGAEVTGSTTKELETSTVRLAGKKAFVTGLGGGISSAIAKTSAGEEAWLASTDIDEVALAAVVAGITAGGGKSFQPRGHIKTLYVDVLSVVNNVAQIDANSETEAACLQSSLHCYSCVYSTLNRKELKKYPSPVNFTNLRE